MKIRVFSSANLPDFIHSYLVKDPEKRIKMRDLYPLFVNWCKAEDWPYVPTRTWLLQRIQKARPDLLIYRSNGQAFILGYSIKQEK
jgi:hypothetical protein